MEKTKRIFGGYVDRELVIHQRRQLERLHNNIAEEINQIVVNGGVPDASLLDQLRDVQSELNALPVAPVAPVAPAAPAAPAAPVAPALVPHINAVQLPNVAISDHELSEYIFELLNLDNECARLYSLEHTPNIDAELTQIHNRHSRLYTLIEHYSILRSRITDEPLYNIDERNIRDIDYSRLDVSDEHYDMLYKLYINLFYKRIILELNDRRNNNNINNEEIDEQLNQLTEYIARIEENMRR